MVLQYFAAPVHFNVRALAWQFLSQSSMSLFSTQDTRKLQLLPLQQPMAPGTLPEVGIMAHRASSSRQAYADFELPLMKPHVLSGAMR